jgi:AcrR family transcriptional regulator
VTSDTTPEARDITDGRRAVGARNRDRLLNAAIEVFAQRGYRGTTTRDIAAAAGTTERTLFRQFPSKAALFQEAVAGPVEQFFTDFRASWAARPRGSRDSETEIREFFESLRTVLEGERALLQAFLAAMSVAEGEGLGDLRSTFTPVIDSLVEIFEVEAELRGWPVDRGIAVRLIIGMAFSATVHRDWLFTDEQLGDFDQLVEQLVRMTLWGLEGPRRGAGR